jgi:hypothetical protein
MCLLPYVACCQGAAWYLSSATVISSALDALSGTDYLITGSAAFVRIRWHQSVPFLLLNVLQLHAVGQTVMVMVGYRYTAATRQ